MFYKLGRSLQFVGLIILPVAIAGNATDSMSLGQMLTVAAVGIGVFALGWLVQQQGQP